MPSAGEERQRPRPAPARRARRLGRTGLVSGAVQVRSAAGAAPVCYVPPDLEATLSGELTGDALRAVMRGLREARERAIATMPVAEIVAGIDRAVAGVADLAGTKSAQWLHEATGYSPEMIGWALEDLSRAFRAPALERLLRRELGDPEALDRFVPRRYGGGATRAVGPALTTIVLSGNVFHVAAESIVLALLVKSACLVKASARDQVFSVLFARLLANVDPRLAAALAVVRWRGGDVQIEHAAFGCADVVVVYGGAEAVAGVRQRTPAHVPLVAHGPRISFAVVARGRATDAATARAAAHDVSFLDQQGCVAPHTIYVEGDAGAARRFARLLAAAMRRFEQLHPRAALAAGESTAIMQTRGAAEFRPGTEVFADPTGTTWTVIVDPESTFEASCLNRLVYVKPLPSLRRLPALLTPARPYLQTVGVAGDAAFRAAVADVVAPLGVCRVCPLGRMQHPPADWRHDGRPRLLDLLRWCDLEEPAGGEPWPASAR